MTVIIDLTTSEKMEAFGKAMGVAASTGKPVDLADVAEASGTLKGSKVCFQTVHYHIVDHGADWKGRWIHRFVLERKPEYRRSRVMENHAASDQSAEILIDAMDNAEKFHLENMPHCGGF
jgi:hypothetical protein